MADQSSNDLIVGSPDTTHAGALEASLALHGWGGYATLGGFLQARGALISESEQIPLVLTVGDTAYAERDISRLLLPTATQQYASAVRSGEDLLVNLAQSANVEIELVDPQVSPESVLSPSEFTSLLASGRRVAHQLADAGHPIIGCAAFGRGNSTVAGAVVGAMTKTEPVVMAGSPFVIGDERWKRKVETIRDAMFSVRAHVNQAHQVARLVGSPSLVFFIGFIAQAAARRVTLMIDGSLCAAAALCAEELAPGTREWILGAHAPTGPVEDIVYRRLGIPQASPLDISVPGGAGVIASVPALRQAARVAKHFEESGRETTPPQAMAD